MSEYKALCAKSKESVLRDKQQWADSIASEAEKVLQCGQLKDAFCNYRRLRSARPRISSPVTLADGTFVTDKKPLEGPFLQLAESSACPTVRRSR